MGKQPPDPEPVEPSVRETKGGGGSVWGYIITLILAGVLCYFMVGNLSVSKNDFTDNVGIIVADLQSAKSQMLTEENIDSFLTGHLGNYVTQPPEGDSYVLTSELPAPPEATDLSNYYTKAQIDILLETNGNGGEDGNGDAEPEEAVTCDLRVWGGAITVYPDEDSDPDGLTDYEVKVKVINNTENDLEDVLFYFYVHPSKAVTFIGIDCSLSWVYPEWILLGSPSPWGFAFQNYWGFDLDAGETIETSLWLTLSFDDITSPVMFDFEMECEDYDIKN